VDGTTTPSGQGNDSPGPPDPRDGLGDEALPDRNTAREGTLHYREVFEPSIVPFKRSRALDQVGLDYGIRNESRTFQVIEPEGNRVTGGRSVFWGSLLLESAAGERIPIPSVSPESRILSYDASPPQRIIFERDEADNFYATPERSGRVRLVFVTDAPSRWFGGPIADDATFGAIPRALRPTPPRAVAEAGRAVAAQLGLGGRGRTFGDTLNRLVAYFRGFEPGEPTTPTADVYRDLALGRRGVCRHRAHAFVVTAQALGIPARYVFNEAHVFVEVYIPGRDAGWMRIDLGGAAEALVVHGAVDGTRHVPTESDPFERPRSFEAEGLAGARSVSGLPASAPLEDTSSGRDDPPAQRLPIARARTAPNLLPTTTTVTLGESLVFRGEGLEVSGEVRGPRGEAVTGGTVQVLLIGGDAASSEEAVGLLGSTLLDPRGRFRVKVEIPLTYATGGYEVVAEFLGHGPYAGSTGR
jgi:transglutaminase-like putative cysteine protease